MTQRFNPPPNWPAAPEGWQPEPGWQPDPAWGPPPYGWELWPEDKARPDLGHRGSAYYSLFAVALVICFGGGVALASIGKAMEIDVLATLGYAPAALTLKLHKLLIGRLTHRSTAEAVLAAGFSQPWPIVLVVAALIYFVALQVAGGVAGFVAPPQLVAPEIWSAAAFVGTILVTVAVLPLLGLWVGLRVEMGAYLLPPLAGLLGQLLGITLTTLVIANESPELEAMRSLYLNYSAVGSALLLGLASGAILGIPFVYFGRQHRESQYAAWVVRRTDRARGDRVLSAAAASVRS